MKLTFVTQNLGPFRLKWMDELGKYMDVEFLHINEYEKNINPKYLNYNFSNIKVKDISRCILWKKIFKIKMILDSNYDVLLLDGYGFFAQQILIIYLIIRRKKFGMTVDGGFIPTNENWFKRKIKSIFISHSSFYFSTSKETDNFLIHYGAKKQFIFRHMFSNINDIDLQTRILTKNEKTLLKYNLGMKDVFTIISVGKLIYGKGFDILSKALSEIDAEIQVLIIGATKNNEIDPIVLNNPKIKIIDFLSKDELDQYYLASDLFVLPTRGDTWGLVVTEAMAKGLPIITTNMCLAGVAIVENDINGYIIQSENILQLKEAIIRMMNSDLNKIGYNNLNKIKAYTIDNSTKDDFENLRIITNQLKGNDADD